MLQISNEQIAFTLDADGQGFALGFPGEEPALACRGRLFDMMVALDGWREARLPLDGQQAHVAQEGDNLIIRYRGVRHAGRQHDLDLLFRFSLDGEGIRCTAHLENRSDLVVEELWFPWVGPFAALGADPAADTLILPEGFGRRVENPAAYVAGHHTGYMAPDQKRVLACAHYPGGWMTMGWLGLYGDGRGLGLLSLDESFQTTGLTLARDSDTGLLSMGFARYPFLARGEWQSPPSLIRLHRGDWHADARAYRAWADAAWWSQSPRPRWVERMHGWQRIIMKHQYGEIFYRYPDLVECFEAGRRYGLDTLLVFGWFSGGMDNGYPAYEPDEALGGEKALREAIAEIQRRGGRVILYANGHLIDVDTEYYREIGHRICLKTSQGSEYREAYRFSGDGTYLRTFGARSFVAGCQSTPEWRDQLLAIGRRMAGLGADGIFYDQLGGHVPYLCFDPSHPHAGPALAQGPGKNANLAAIRRELVDPYPERAFGTELVSDCLDRHVDFVHTCTFGASPHPQAVPEVFRYTFPEILLTSREIRDERDHVRRMNWTFLYGWRFDVEIWRCRGDLRSAPAYGEYMSRLIALRERWPDLLMSGLFRDEEFFAAGNPNIRARGYEGEGRFAIIAWNDTGEAQPFAPAVREGLTFREGATPDGAFAPGDALPPQSVAVLVYA